MANSTVWYSFSTSKVWWDRCCGPCGWQGHHSQRHHCSALARFFQPFGDALDPHKGSFGLEFTEFRVFRAVLEGGQGLWRICYSLSPSIFLGFVQDVTKQPPAVDKEKPGVRRRWGDPQIWRDLYPASCGLGGLLALGWVEMSDSQSSFFSFFFQSFRLCLTPSGYWKGIESKNRYFHVFSYFFQSVILMDRKTHGLCYKGLGRSCLVSNESRPKWTTTKRSNSTKKPSKPVTPPKTIQNQELTLPFLGGYLVPNL